MVRVKFIEKRRIIKVGRAYYLTIPKRLAGKLKLKEGDEVLLYLTEDNRIVLSPAERREEVL